MKFTIDTVAKTIEVEGSANLADLTESLKKYLGDDYTDYVIKDNAVTKWYPYYPSYPAYPVWPLVNPTITYLGASQQGTYTLQNP
jgi:hypothetical protein